MKRHCSYPHFTGEKTKAQRGCIESQGYKLVEVVESVLKPRLSDFNSFPPTLLRYN